MHIKPHEVISIDAELNVPQANYQDKQRFYNRTIPSPATRKQHYPV